VTALWDKGAGASGWSRARARATRGREPSTARARRGAGTSASPPWRPATPRLGAARGPRAPVGRPWRVVAHGRTLRASYREERFAFTRVLDLHGQTLSVAYELEGEGDLPWMWSQHCLLAARPGETDRPGGLEGVRTEREALGWPATRGATCPWWAPERRLRPQGLRRRPRARPAALEGAEGGIAFAWDAGQIGSLGLWLDWGGWPEDPALGAPSTRSPWSPPPRPSTTSRAPRRPGRRGRCGPPPGA
jgi:hypothetical protein